MNVWLFGFSGTSCPALLKDGDMSFQFIWWRRLCKYVKQWEGLAACVAYLQVTAVDADSGINAEIIYNIEPGHNSTIADSFFVVDSSSGEVRLSTALSPGDVNSSYVMTVTATDAGTPPLSSSVRLCATVVDRNVSENHLGSVVHRRLAIEFDATVTAALLVGLLLCAFIVVVVIIAAVVTQRRARRRRRRQLNHCKNPSHYKLVDVWNGTLDDDRTENRQAVNDDIDDDGDGGCSRPTGVPRTVIRTLDRSPRSSRGADVGTRRSCCAAPLCRGNSSSPWRRQQPDGRVSLNHFHAEPPSHTCGSNVWCFLHYTIMIVMCHVSFL